jgi:deazaflavin-dependent oxidoreductase (nitroreductase family)
MAEEVFDSPDAWVAQHIRRYVETGGRARPGVPELLLTTRGRRSGRLRRTVVVYARDGDRYVVAASNAGADRHPAWYLNLVEDPGITVQVGAETFAGHARTAAPGESPRLWELMVETMPAYRDYQEMTERDIPVVIIERADPGPARTGYAASGTPGRSGELRRPETLAERAVGGSVPDRAGHGMSGPEGSAPPSVGDRKGRRPECWSG